MNEIFLTALEISAAASVIILLVAILSRIIDKKYTSGWKYWIWILIAIRLIIPFNPETEIFRRKIEVEVPNTVIYVPQENLSTEPELIVPSDAQTGAQNFEPSETIIPEEKPESKKNATLLDFLSAVWIGGAVVIFVWNVGAYLVFRNATLRMSKPASSETRRVLSEIKSSLGISENIETVVCENVKSPMIMGFLNPKLVLPSEDYPEDSLCFILRHELTHFRRKDTLYKAVLLIANAIHWFNPVVWLMRKLAAADLEVSCDAQVIKGSDMEIRKRYSETILSCVHQEKAPCAVFSTHFYGGAKTLKKRFENILSTKKRKKGAAAFIFVLILALVLGGTVACTAANPSSENENSKTEAPDEEKVRELVLKANAVYQPGDESVLEIISYENYIDEHYYNKTGNFYEAVPEIFSEAGIEQIFSVKDPVSFRPVFFEKDGSVYCFSPMTDGDATNYYDTITGITLAQKRENFFRYKIEHSAKRKDGISENFESYVTIVFEDGKYLVSDFDPIRYTFEEAPEIFTEQQRAAEIYNSELHAEYIARINQTIENHRSGTYVPMDNHHPPYPEDFPDAKNLPDADRNNVLIAWRNSVQLDANTVQDGAVYYFYIIDDTHAIIFEPAVFVHANGTTSYGFGNTAYLGKNVKNYVLENYDGYFGTMLWFKEPELIADHIAALNQWSYGNFGAVCEERYGTFLFKEYPEDITSAPYAVTFEKVVYDGITDMYDGYYLDPFERTVQEVKNFSSADEMLGYMEQYIHEDMLPNPANLYGSFMEFDGKLYKTTGNVGNVGITYGNSEIISQTEKHMTVSAKLYVAYSGQEYGSSTIEFEKFGEGWKIVSVEDSSKIEIVPEEPSGNFSINDIDTSEYDDIADWEFLYVLSKTEGKRDYKQLDSKGLSYMGEEPNEQVWFLSKNGEFLNEEPFQYGGVPFEGNPGEWWVYGIRDGVLYPFYIDENTGEFTEEEPWGARSVESFGYSVFEYYWDYHTVHYGVLSPDGSIFAEPIYTIASVPCENRIVLINGGQIMNEMVCIIYDENKNVINESFNHIFYNYDCPDGYIGIAYCGDPNDPATIIRFDKNGNPMETGYYFVDGSGNIIKGPFKTFTINDDYADNTITSGEDIIKIVYFNGEEEEFPAKEILIKD